MKTLRSIIKKYPKINDGRKIARKNLITEGCPKLTIDRVNRAAGDFDCFCRYNICREW